MSEAYRRPSEVAWREAWAADAAWIIGWHLKTAALALSALMITGVLLGLAVFRPFVRPGHAAGGWLFAAVVGTIGLLCGWATLGILRDALHVIATMWRRARVEEGPVTARAMTPPTRHSFAEYWITVGTVRVLVPASVYEVASVGTRVRVEHGGPGGPARRASLIAPATVDS